MHRWRAPAAHMRRHRAASPQSIRALAHTERQSLCQPLLLAVSSERPASMQASMQACTRGGACRAMSTLCHVMVWLWPHSHASALPLTVCTPPWSGAGSARGWRCRAPQTCGHAPRHVPRAMSHRVACTPRDVTCHHVWVHAAQRRAAAHSMHSAHAAASAHQPISLSGAPRTLRPALHPPHAHPT